MRKAKVALPVLASALIIGIVVVLLWMGGSASGERARFSSLGIAPKEADIFVAVNTDPTSPQWLAVDGSLEAINAKDPVRRAIDKALAEVNLDWEDDILPAAGDEAFFSVPDISKLDEGGYVAGFRLRDTGKARKVFVSLRARAEEDGEEFKQEDYQGVTVYYTQDTSSFANSDNGAVALLDDVLAVGASPDAVKGVIDVVQGRAPSAEENQRLQEFRAAQKEDFLTWGYADLGSMWDTLEQGLPASLGSDSGFDGFDSGDSGVATPEPVPTVAPTPSPGVPRDDDFAVRSFDSEILIDSSGSFLVTERIAVDFGDAPKHGIFRDIAIKVPYDLAHNELLEIGNVGVTRDGQPDSYQTSRSEAYVEVQIGDPDRTITGAHEYVIQYTVHGGIFRFPGVDDSYRLSWNVTGDRWSVPIESASATVTSLTGEVVESNCTVGVAPTDTFNVYLSEGCEEGIPSVQSVTLTSDGPILPGTGLGIQVSVQGTVAAPPPVLIERDSFSYGGFEFPTDVPQEPDQPAFPFNFDSKEVIDELRSTYDRVGFSLSAADEGFALDLTVLHAPDFKPAYPVEPAVAFDSHFAGSVPADTMFFIAGYDIYAQTKGLSDYLDKFGSPSGPDAADSLAEFKDATGLDLVEDVLALFTGEYALAGNVSNFEGEPPDVTVLALVDVNDTAKTEDALRAIGDALKDRDAVNIDDSGDVQRWQVADTPDIEAFGVTIDGNSLIAGYPYSAVEDYVNGFDKSLADTNDWKRTLELLPPDTTSIGYVSLARIFEELRGTGAEDSFNESTNGELTLEDLAAIRSVGFATTSRDNGFGMHYVVFLEDR